MQTTDGEDPNDPHDSITIVLEDPEDPGDFVGEYPSIESYLRSSLEEFIHPTAHWLLNHVDFAAVRSHLENDGCRYEWITGRVFCRSPTRR